jgi:hypothetical protein
MASSYNDMQAGSDNSPLPSDDKPEYYEIGKLRRQYYDYLGVKSDEIAEQKESRRYYHGAQWTDKEIRTLKKRKQPVITKNKIARKINAVIGLVERLRQDPKAYPRTPKQEQGADVATAVMRYALDHVDWKSKSPRCARMAAIDGLAGIELDIAQGDHGDPDIDLHIVYPDTFFYDPRSYDDGFTDARFMGVSKWVDVEQAKELVPLKAEQIDGLIESGTDLTANSDREITWVNTSSKKVRLIDHWYIYKGKWCWALYIGNAILMEGISPYIDERGKSFSKFLMFAASVDHDGDRYGFVRNFKGAQDEVNHRNSKALHILNSKQVIADKGAVDDVEAARLQVARPDGYIEKNPGKNFEIVPPQADFMGQLELMKEANNDIDNFGPNPALVGNGLESSSGKAISLLQQAGIAELGPYILAHKAWKIRVYRSIWNIVQRYWTAERWIRVTDDDGLGQFIQVNGLSLDQYGQPALVNVIGSLDVDIIIDEGPDTVTMMQDVFDTLQQIIPSIAPMLSPAEASAALGILIETSPLPEAAKKKFKQASEQPPDPMQVQAKQIGLAGQAAKVTETKAKTFRDFASAAKQLHDAHIDAQTLGRETGQQSAPQPQGQQISPPQPPQGFGPVPPDMNPVGGIPPMQPQLPLQMPGQIPQGALVR